MSKVNYLRDLLLPVWIVLEKMALLMMIVGEKMLSGGMPGLDTMMAWFPDTMNRGNRMENTQPAITCRINR